MTPVGDIDLVPPARRVGGVGASYLMASFTHVSSDRPSRFSAGHHDVLYVARSYETALFATIHHHARFMARTAEPVGWTSQFREIILKVHADLHDHRADVAAFGPCLDPGCYQAAQQLAATLQSQARTVLPIQASGRPVENASRFSIRIAPRAPSRVGILIIIGMESGSIWLGMRAAALCSWS